MDLTPMVDLAFLLITFFMLTTSLLKQKAMELSMPMDKGPQMPVSECQVLNLLTDSLGQTYYYESLDCKVVQQIPMTGDHGLKDKIKEKGEFLRHNCLYVSGKQKGIICLIKLLPGSRYDQMIQILNEMAASHVETYAIQSYSEEEVRAVGLAEKGALSQK